MLGELSLPRNAGERPNGLATHVAGVLVIRTLLDGGLDVLVFPQTEFHLEINGKFCSWRNLLVWFHRLFMSTYQCLLLSSDGPVTLQSSQVFGGNEGETTSIVQPHRLTILSNTSNLRIEIPAPVKHEKFSKLLNLLYFLYLNTYTSNKGSQKSIRCLRRQF